MRTSSRSPIKEDHQAPNAWKGLVAGLVAGVVASWAMDRFQYLWLSLSPGDNVGAAGRDSLKDGTPNLSENRGDRVASNGEAEDDTTKKTASAISQAIFGHKLTPAEKEIAGSTVHYAISAADGIAYGVAAEFAPRVAAGLGLPFGTALWLGLDEGIVPLLGLSKGPREYPLKTHIYALASHLVFGGVAELTRRAVRARL